jgi:hypothetical protein
MKEDSTLRRYRTELDENLTDVMPDSWKGHARLTIRQSDKVPDEIKESAVEKAVELYQKKDKSPEKAANDLIKAIVKKNQE